MIKVVAFRVLFEQAEAASIGVLLGVDYVVRFVEVNLVIVPDNLSLRLSLQTHFHDVPRLVVEQTVRVSQPRHSSEENTNNNNKLENLEAGSFINKKAAHQSCTAIRKIVIID